jgi:putative ABC transport system ATP-binding protein
MIRLKNVTKEFVAEGDDVFAVRDVSLEIKKGEFVSIMGRSGSGKSTLLHLIGGLEPPTAGTAEVSGRQLDTLTDADLTQFRRDHIGVIFQFFNLLPTLSVAENIALPARLSRNTAGLDRRVSDLMERVGLQHRADFRPHRLSGGEMQRAAIARALVNDPSVVLADEPTGNLDTSASETVMKLLRGVADSGCTVVLVTHSSEAAAFGDRCLWMHDGRLEAECPEAALGSRVL